MCSLLIGVIASVVGVSVPDSGITGYLLGLSIVSLGLVARFLKNRKG
jgi:hypothetical protein